MLKLVRQQAGSYGIAQGLGDGLGPDQVKIFMRRFGALHHSAG